MADHDIIEDYCFPPCDPPTGVWALTEEEKGIIIKHREEKAEREWTPKLSSHYSAGEKCKIFDDLHEAALCNFKYKEKTGQQMGSIEQWAIEALMELLGEDVWNKYNNF